MESIRKFGIVQSPFEPARLHGYRPLDFRPEAIVVIPTNAATGRATCLDIEHVTKLLVEEFFPFHIETVSEKQGIEMNPENFAQRFPVWQAHVLPEVIIAKTGQGHLASVTLRLIAALVHEQQGQQILIFIGPACCNLHDPGGEFQLSGRHGFVGVTLFGAYL